MSASSRCKGSCVDVLSPCSRSWPPAWPPLAQRSRQWHRASPFTMGSPRLDAGCCVRAAGHWGGGARCPLGVLAPQWFGYGGYGGAVWPPVNVPPVPWGWRARCCPAASLGRVDSGEAAGTVTRSLGASKGQADPHLAPTQSTCWGC